MYILLTLKAKVKELFNVQDRRVRGNTLYPFSVAVDMIHCKPQIHYAALLLESQGGEHVVRLVCLVVNITPTHIPPDNLTTDCSRTSI